MILLVFSLVLVLDEGLRPAAAAALFMGYILFLGLWALRRAADARPEQADTVS